MKILFSPNCPRICAIRWFGGEKSRFFHEFATQRPCGPQCAPRGRAWPERTASLLLPGADSRPAPAAPRRRSSRRGGLYGRPGSTRVRRKSGACSGGHKGRPYAALSTWSVGRAHTPPNQPAGTTGLAAISKGRALCPPEPRRRAEPAPAFHIKYPAACPAAGLND